MARNDKSKVVVTDTASATRTMVDDAASFATAQSNLGAQLLFTANALDQRRESLNASKRALGRELSARIGAEGRLVAQALRLTVGVVWLCVAAILFIKSGQLAQVGLTGDPSVVAGLSADEASTLARVFFIAGLPACLFAIGVALYVQTTRGNNQRVRRAADRLGIEIADEAIALDRDVSGLVQSITRGGSLGVDIENLSKAQYKAFEAQMFFRGLRFLTPETHQQSMADLKKFVSGGGNVSIPMVFMTAFFMGAVFSYLAFGKTTSVPAGPLPDIFLYPGYMLMLVGGGFIYLAAGVLGGLIAPAFGAVRRRALEDALDAVRGAFTANNAPRFAEIVRRVDDAMAVLLSRAEALESDAARGRTRKETKTDLSSPGDKGVTKDASPDLAWRNRDSAARFVDTGFQAAPKPFALDSESIRPGKSTPSGKPRAPHRAKWF